jgi:hypothetical protein
MIRGEVSVQVGLLMLSTAQALADDAIPSACPHPAGARALHLPSQILVCQDCIPLAATGPDSQPGPCACCGADDASNWSCWTDEVAAVLVVARVCQDCGDGCRAVP